MDRNEYPYDEVDMCFMLVTAMYPSLFILAIVQYLARRSNKVRNVAFKVFEDAKALPLPKPKTLEAPKGENLLVTSKDLMQVLSDAYHLLIIGHTGGGKTTLIHEFARHLANEDHQVFVGDPDAAPGQWPGCKVYGAGDDFQSIEKMLLEVKAVIAERRHLRAEKGLRVFPLLYIVVDEIADVMAECPSMRPMFEALVRRGRKIGIRFVAGVQDKLVKTLKLEGQSELRKNLVSVELRLKNGRRTATVNEYEDGMLFTVPVPVLRSPEDFILEGVDDNILLESLLIPTRVRSSPEQFVQECCVEQLGGRITAGSLYEAYKQWCEDPNPANPTAFGLALNKLGLVKDRTSKGYIEYQDIGVVNAVRNQSSLAVIR